MRAVASQVFRQRRQGTRLQDAARHLARQPVQDCQPERKDAGEGRSSRAAEPEPDDSRSNTSASQENREPVLTVTVRPGRHGIRLPHHQVRTVDAGTRGSRGRHQHWQTVPANLPLPQRDIAKQHHVMKKPATATSLVRTKIQLHQFALGDTTRFGVNNAD